jgi:hypothetical protein
MVRTGEKAGNVEKKRKEAFPATYLRNRVDKLDKLP